jgi:hypothetical protein
VLATRPIGVSGFTASKATPIKASVIKDAPQRWYHVCTASDMSAAGTASSIMMNTVNGAANDCIRTVW